MRGGILRRSLEQTLGLSHIGSVGKEEAAVVVGTCLIRFLIFFVYCSFVFPFIFTFSFFSIFIFCQQKEFLLRLFLLLERHDIRTSTGNSIRQNTCVGYVFPRRLKVAVGCSIFPTCVTLS